jgi:hypothetical protein
MLNTQNLSTYRIEARIELPIELFNTTLTIVILAFAGMTADHYAA